MEFPVQNIGEQTEFPSILKNTPPTFSLIIVYTSYEYSTE